jgi:hypothetical protein
MDEHAVAQALRAMSHRMPGADIASLVVPVTRAWNGDREGGRLTATRAVIADAAWGPGYAAGVAHGHQFVTDFFVQAAEQLFDRDSQQVDARAETVLEAVIGAAALVAMAGPTVTDDGPSRRDSLAAMGEVGGDTDAEHAAIAARVGWTHGYHTGDADGGWSAAGHIVGMVEFLLSDETLRLTEVGGVNARDWLIHLDVTSRQHSEHDVAHPRSAAAQAFPQLRQVSAVTTETPSVASGNAPQQRHGRHR